MILLDDHSWHTLTDITLGTHASINGRLLAQTAVTLDQSTIYINFQLVLFCSALTTAAVSVCKADGSSGGVTTTGTATGSKTAC